MTEMLDAPVREVCIQFTGSMRSIEAQHCCYLPAGRSPGGIFIFDVDQELSHLLTRLSYIRHHTFLRRMDNSPMSMGDRLRHAREAAGYKTATAAVEHFNWPNSTYRAHENGQNNFSPAVAKIYANAYGVSAAWLLLDDANKIQARSTRATKHKHDCAESIQSAALLLKSDPNNLALIDIIDACAASLRAKAGRH